MHGNGKDKQGNAKQEKAACCKQVVNVESPARMTAAIAEAIIAANRNAMVRNFVNPRLKVNGGGL